MGAHAATSWYWIVSAALSAGAAGGAALVWVSKKFAEEFLKRIADWASDLFPKRKLQRPSEKSHTFIVHMDTGNSTFEGAVFNGPVIFVSVADFDLERAMPFFLSGNTHLLPPLIEGSV